MRAFPNRDDSGFTLIESVIAMLVMTIAVVTIVGALATMITFIGEHRQHAVAETSTRSAGQLATATVMGTSLASPITAGQTDGLPLTDVYRVLPEGGGTASTAAHAETYVQIGAEVMRVRTRNEAAGTIDVERRVGWDAALPATGYSDDARVVPILRCPTAEQLEASVDTLVLGDGVTVAVPVDGVTYWKPGGIAGTYQNRTGCLADYNLRCPPPEALAECGFGLVRVRVQVDTPDDPRLNSRETELLLRQGSV